MKTRRYRKRSLIKKKGKRRLRKVKSKYRKKKSRSRRVTRKKRGGLSGLGIGLISLAGVGLGVGGYFGSKHISSQRKKKREIRIKIADRQQPNFMEWDDGGNVITDIQHARNRGWETSAKAPPPEILDNLSKNKKKDFEYWKAVDKIADDNRRVSYDESNEKQYEKPKCPIPLHIQLKFNVDEFGKPKTEPKMPKNTPYIPTSYTPEEKAELNHWLTNC